MGKRATGLGERPDDRWAVPLCRECHLDGQDSQHRVGEAAFWARAGLDPHAIAAGLYAEFLAVAKFRFRKAIGESVAKLKPARPLKRSVAFRAKNQVKRPIPRRANPWPAGRKLRSRR
jgi:hypothetical protein